MPSFVALISCSATEPVHFVKIEKKEIVKKCLEIATDILYLMVKCSARENTNKRADQRTKTNSS